MNMTEATRVLKAETMACWWQSDPPNWEGILGEVSVLQEGIQARQGIPKHAPFYVLDDDDPETEMHDRLAVARGAVLQQLTHRRQCRQSDCNCQGVAEHHG